MGADPHELGFGFVFMVIVILGGGCVYNEEGATAGWAFVSVVSRRGLQGLTSSFLPAGAVSTSQARLPVTLRGSCWFSVGNLSRGDKSVLESENSNGLSNFESWAPNQGASH